MDRKREGSSYLSPEQIEQARLLLETPSWEVREILNIPASKVNFEMVERPFSEPPEARELRLKIWDSMLSERLKDIQSANPNAKYEIIDDNEGEGATHHRALFETQSDGSKKKRMWAGNTITTSPEGLKRMKNGNINIPVYPLNYSEIHACRDAEYRKILERNGIPLPDAGVGIVVLMETKDGIIPLTRRGIETPTYPGRLHSVGGNPKPELNLIDNFKDEIGEELGLVEGRDYDIGKMRILGIASDKNFNGNPNPRPEVVAYVPLGKSYREVVAKQQEMMEKAGGQQEDVWSLEPVSTDRISLESAITLHGYEMCPPLEAGLAMVLLNKLQSSEGPGATDALKKTMDKVKRYERSNFQPPIKRLAR